MMMGETGVSSDGIIFRHQGILLGWNDYMMNRKLARQRTEDEVF